MTICQALVPARPETILRSTRAMPAARLHSHVLSVALPKQVRCLRIPSSDA
jgi:hypothetical protein